MDKGKKRRVNKGQGLEINVDSVSVLESNTGSVVDSNELSYFEDAIDDTSII